MVVGIIGLLILAAYHPEVFPILKIGIPLMIIARIIRYFADQQEIKKTKEVRKMFPIETGTNRSFLPGSYPLSSYGYGGGCILERKDPLTALAEQAPHFASDVMINKILAGTHENIASKPAEIFALNGKGIIARTTRRRGFFSDSITTEVHPV